MADVKRTDNEGDRIRCPNCGEWILHLWDFEFGDREICEFWCGECDSKLSLVERHSISYTCLPGWGNRP